MNRSSISGATSICDFIYFNLKYSAPSFLKLFFCSADNLWAFGIISVRYISNYNCLASQYIS